MQTQAHGGEAQRAEHQPIARVVLDAGRASGTDLDYSYRISRIHKRYPAPGARAILGQTRQRHHPGARRTQRDPQTPRCVLNRCWAGNPFPRGLGIADRTGVRRHRANIVRLAVPPRVASNTSSGASFAGCCARQTMCAQRADDLASGLYLITRTCGWRDLVGGKGAFVVDAMPWAGHWALLFALMVLRALAAVAGLLR